VSLVGAYLATLSGAGGSGGTVVVISDATVYDANSGSAQASYSLTLAGEIFAITTLDGFISIGDWISPTSAAPGSYEARADIVFGSVSGSATGSWLALTSTRTWTVARSSPGRSESRITVQIRLSGTVITTATIDLSVQVEFDYGGGGVIP
jgi:hypothetical protein